MWSSFYILQSPLHSVVFHTLSLHIFNNCSLSLLFSVSPLLYSLQAICDVSLAQILDVEKAVTAAKEAFENGEWGKMNPRDRGRLLYK